MDCGFSRSYDAHWTTGRALGRGAYGVVHEARAKPGSPSAVDDQLAAVKILRKDRLTSACSLQKEVAVMRLLTQSCAPSTVHLLGAYEDHAHVYLVLTLASGGDVYDRIAAAGGQPYSESDAAACVACVCTALAHAHMHGVVSLDVKLENFLICDGALLLADWGLARFLAPGDIGTTRPVGTAYYCAPELLTDHKFGPESDCWSLGVATYILLAGRAPFNGADEHATLARIAMDPSPPDYSPLSPGARDFVSQLLVREPAMRMTAAEALSHPWLGIASGSLAEAQRHPLDASVLVGLRAFRRVGRMRRLALHALAATFEPRELPALWDQYSAALHAGEPGGAKRLAAALRMMPQGHSPGHVDVDALINELDNDGCIGWAEFLAGALRGRHLRALREADPLSWARHVGAAFAALAQDSKFLSDGELAQLLASSDAGGDSRVSREEFEALLKRSESSADA